MNTLDLVSKLRRLGALQREADDKQHELRSFYVSIIDPLLDQIAEEPFPAADSDFWIELKESSQIFKMLQAEATAKEYAVTDMKATEVEPLLKTFRATLGLSSEMALLPDFWKDLQAEQGYAAFALSLVLLVRLKISRLEFEAKARQMWTTDPDAIFLALLDDSGKGDFTKN
jgi:hypothetical protein